VVEDSTRERYTYVINKHILPHLGTMRMRDLMPWHVRDWITDLVEAGVRPPAIRSAKVCLDAILSTAFHDQVTSLHAGRGVKTPPVPRKSGTIITAVHYQRLHQALRDPDMQLLEQLPRQVRAADRREVEHEKADLPAGRPLLGRAEPVAAEVSVGGEEYGVSIGAHRVNVLWFNKKLLAKAGVRPTGEWLHRQHLRRRPRKGPRGGHRPAMPLG
jgi:Phage integrase, N-terminal SAM-like domain